MSENYWNISIHVDASNKIGTGHVMRCLTLAGELREQVCKVQFICREHSGHMTDTITSKRLCSKFTPSSVMRYGVLLIL